MKQHRHGCFIILDKDNLMDDDVFPLGEKLRRVMRHWVTGVAVVTSVMGERRHGMTVNSFVSISLDPPLVTVTMNRDTRTLALVQESGVFAVTILSRTQEELAQRFSGRIQDGEERMAGLETFTLFTGAPLLRGGAAYLDCRVVCQYEMRHATLFVGEVLAAQPDGEMLPPLVYNNRKFMGLQDTP
jgi:flavin reductase (DIM6/NTAB) family NADH-FMN oxidoreductase RutF